MPASAGKNKNIERSTDRMALNDASADVYSLQGVLVRQQATSTDGLPKGIYIVKAGDATRKLVVQ